MRPNGTARFEYSSASAAAAAFSSFVPSFASIFPQIGVAISPGCKELTRILSFAWAHSSATAFAKSRTAPLDAQ